MGCFESKEEERAGAVTLPARPAGNGINATHAPAAPPPPLLLAENGASKPKRPTNPVSTTDRGGPSGQASPARAPALPAPVPVPMKPPVAPVLPGSSHSSDHSSPMSALSAPDPAASPGRTALNNRIVAKAASPKPAAAASAASHVKPTAASAGVSQPTIAPALASPAAAPPASYVARWLSGLGLPQYTAVFEAAGFDDALTLGTLSEADLVLIESFTGVAMPPGHRKKLLVSTAALPRAVPDMGFGLVPPPPPTEGDTLDAGAPTPPGAVSASASLLPADQGGSWRLPSPDALAEAAPPPSAPPASKWRVSSGGGGAAVVIGLRDNRGDADSDSASDSGPTRPNIRRTIPTPGGLALEVAATHQPPPAEGPRRALFGSYQLQGSNGSVPMAAADDGALAGSSPPPSPARVLPLLTALYESKAAAAASPGWTPPRQMGGSTTTNSLWGGRSITGAGPSPLPLPPMLPLGPFSGDGDPPRWAMRRSLRASVDEALGGATAAIRRADSGDSQTATAAASPLGAIGAVRAGGAAAAVREAAAALRSAAATMGYTPPDAGGDVTALGGPPLPMWARSPSPRSRGAAIASPPPAPRSPPARLSVAARLAAQATALAAGATVPSSPHDRMIPSVTPAPPPPPFGDLEALDRELDLRIRRLQSTFTTTPGTAAAVSPANSVRVLGDPRNPPVVQLSPGPSVLHGAKRDSGLLAELAMIEAKTRSRVLSYRDSVR